MLVQTWCFVLFNKVVTAQYFLWFLTLLPVVLINNELGKKANLGYVFGYAALWLVAHVGALMPCKWFEFDGLASFYQINLGNYFFFIVNLIGCLGVLRNHNLTVQSEFGRGSSITQGKKE